ncbi:MULTISPECIES: FKBP-type peptidyl-prolyl cis-trans isomerase [Ferrimonas]|uniref:FKBP-type peptidyl-prolyl cis-trans isomerase n=1 Tax=Ferrimonas TaxID=44011 RepID=UPI001B7FE23F|nr:MULTISPECIES: FKBP-type peptidyl-prolyl cis-trans isomerase [Ferrimonas]USD39790.1 FKBP-type peptidyl-prolyl cis-trans isomerase [Ferrimonas sp. SCSIO 43195]
MVVLLVGYFVFKNMNNAKVAPENIRLGDEFLAQNASEEGVQTTASGLQYKVLQPGTGTEHPSASSKVRVHYHGTLLDGTVFDSSVERGEPIEFKLTQVIPGWTEGLQYMVVGEKTRLYIPAKLGYGNRSAGAIQPGSLLIFDVELLAIK